MGLWLGLGRLCSKFHPLFYSYILIYSAIMLSKLTHYAFKCTTMLNYAYQIILFTLHSQCPDHQIHHSLTPYHWTSATIDRETETRTLSHGLVGRGHLTWRGELIIHCTCAFRWPKNRPLLCFSSQNKCPLC